MFKFKSKELETNGYGGVRKWKFPNIIVSNFEALFQFTLSNEFLIVTFLTELDTRYFLLFSTTKNDFSHFLSS